MENREVFDGKDRKDEKDEKDGKGYLVTERRQNGQARILYADKAACELSGLSMEELLQTDPARAAENLEAVRVELDAGHELWILDTVYSRQQHVAELERMNAALEDALKEAEEANRAKSRFLSNMSHDIRTPMNAIVGMTSIGLSHIDEKARVQDCLSKIKTASTHLMSLVNDVLDMSRIDSGRMTLNEEIFSLADLVHDIAVIMRPQAVQKRQKFRIEIGHIYEENLIGDVLRLRQILVNIIGNAVKYTPEEGKIEVSFSQRLQESQNVLLEFTCKDNGIGMSRDFLERIFIPFERVNNTTISKIEGTGLGMAIVKSLVDSMGGEITVESEEGAGSCFSVALPAAVSVQSRKQPEFPENGIVLIAEQRQDRAAQISNYLKESGLTLVRTVSGLETVTWLTEAQYENRLPCAMLLGQELEDMTALELASHVGQLAGHGFPVILVSEEDWSQIEYRAVRAGVSAFVPCPLFRSRLLETMAALTVPSEEEQKQEEKAAADYGKHHVLLAEDIPLNQEIAVEILQVIGVQVEVADNGVQAVEKFQNSPEGYFDIIFMDIQMPVMDGYEAARLIRKLERKDAESVWIVAMTANAFVEDIRLSREAGMNEHCSKPVDPERLQEILKSRLG